MSDLTDPIIKAAKSFVSSDKTVLQAVINAVPAPIFFKDKRGRYLGCNRAFEGYIGMRRNEVVGRTVFELFEGELAKVYAEADEELMRRGGEQVYEAQVRYANGSIRDVMFHKAVFHAEDEGISGLVGVILDITDRKRMEMQYRELALTDTVTSIDNRFSLQRNLQAAMDRMDRLGSPVALMLLDLDDFKGVNDNLGHFSGDAVLREVASRLCAVTRKTDTVARLGGDEFAILIQDIPQISDIEIFAEKVIQASASPIELGEQSVYTHFSVGIAIAPEHAADADSLMHCADKALYRAKSQGKNRFQFYRPE